MKIMGISKFSRQLPRAEYLEIPIRKTAKGIDKSNLLLYNTNREATDDGCFPQKELRNNRPKLSQGWRAVISFLCRYDGRCS